MLPAFHDETDHSPRKFAILGVVPAIEFKFSKLIVSFGFLI